jgi:hypothetical protein
MGHDVKCRFLGINSFGTYLFIDCLLSSVSIHSLELQLELTFTLALSHLESADCKTFQIQKVTNEVNKGEPAIACIF